MIAAVNFSGRSFSGSVNTQLQQLPDLRVDQLLDADFARLVGVAGEGGVDDDALAVADDEQRRVVELQGVVGELLEGGVEVAAGFLVLPAEAAALPDVGPAVAAAGLAGAALEAVVVRVARLGDAEQVAEVVEMGLRAGPLGERVVFPEGDELFRGHGAARAGENRSVAMRVELRNRLAQIRRVFAVNRGNRPFLPPGLHPETSRYTGTVVGAVAPTLFAHEPQ